MTVIAWDGNVLAADKMAGDQVIWRKITKIVHVRGWLLGAAGDSDMSREVIAWFEAGAEPSKFPNQARAIDYCGEILAISPDKEIFIYQRTPYPIKFDGDQIALGSGRDAAMAVMLLGHDAIRAVEIASQICVGCGGGIDSIGRLDVNKK